MNYEKEYEFVMRFLKKLCINTTLINIYENDAPKFDLGLREIIFSGTNYHAFFDYLTSAGKPNTIYQINDKYLCKYFALRLPNKPGTYLLIGPYSDQEITHESILNLADYYNFSPQVYSQLKYFYEQIPFVKDDKNLLTLIITLGEYLWDDISNFSLEKIDPHSIEWAQPVSSDKKETKDEAYITMKTMEERYASENAMMQAVSKGLIQEAEQCIFSSNHLIMEKRLNDPVRNIKNYAIVLNTLLRKSAEQGKVHPIHLDALSSQFAKEIENIISYEKGIELQNIMVKKYCLLVKKNSINHYSLPIQKVITYIDTDLTADLSLSAQATLLKLSPNYLSSLFKKETGTTLTNYVNNKRIEHAVYLLSSTDMQIQNIAQYCGIPDVNYFTKIFKKVMHKTPSEFKEEIR